jgi:hypothetical protein
VQLGGGTGEAAGACKGEKGPDVAEVVDHRTVIISDNN